jgi:hypothetical protein
VRGPRESGAVDEGLWAECGLPGRAAERKRAFACARACWPDGTAAEQELLALHIALITALDDALEATPPAPTVADEYRSLLPWHAAAGSANRLTATDARAPIRAALAHLERSLAYGAGPTAGSSPSAMEWWRHEAEQMVAAAWQESRWRSGGPLPDQESYLAVAELSIGASWLTATLLLLDGGVQAPAAGSPFLAATGAVAAAIRVANDLCDSKRERREGKVQLLFLRARALQARGYRARYAHRRARAEVRAMLAERLARARALLDPCRWTGSHRLRSGLARMLDVALALYGPGPRAADASGRGRTLSAGCEQVARVGRPA